jgi:CRP/FNR family transcriptional regulator, cyclic AMP receptor protein
MKESRIAWPQPGDIMNIMNDAISKHPFFKGMKPEHLALLYSGAKIATFEPGDLIFRVGEPANQFSLIESGRIAVEAHESSNETVRVQTIGPGEVLGWSWLLPPFVWHFQARAIEPVKLIVLNGAHLLAASEQDHDFGYELMKRVTQILIRRLEATRKQLLSSHLQSSLEG